MQEIAVLFQGLKFKKRIFGGVDERDVWKKLDKIQQEYRRIYEAQAVRYRAILEANGIMPDVFDAAINYNSEQE